MGKQDGKIMLKEIWKVGTTDIPIMLKIIHHTNFIYWDLKTLNQIWELSLNY